MYYDLMLLITFTKYFINFLDSDSKQRPPLLFPYIMCEQPSLNSFLPLNSPYPSAIACISCHPVKCLQISISNLTS